MSAGICPPFPRPPYPYLRPPLYSAQAAVAVRRSLRSQVGIATTEIQMARRAELVSRQHPHG